MRGLGFRVSGVWGVVSKQSKSRALGTHSALCDICPYTNPTIPEYGPLEGLVWVVS